MTKKGAGPVRTSKGRSNGHRRLNGVSKAKAGRHHTRKIDPYAQRAALSPAFVAELVEEPSETETNLIMKTDTREGRQAETLVEDPQIPLRLDVGDMSLQDAGFDRQDGEEAPQKHMRVLFDLHLSGQRAQPLSDTGLPYFVQLMAWNLASGQATVLATDRSRLTSGLVTYPVALQFPLPELGRYQLVGLVLLPGEDKVGVMLGNILNVLP